VPGKQQRHTQRAEATNNDTHALTHMHPHTHLQVHRGLHVHKGQRHKLSDARSPGLEKEREREKEDKAVGLL